MEVDRVLQQLLRLEIAILLPLIVMVPILASRYSVPFWIYELFGALLAASITTFGLKEMKGLTE